MKLLPINSKKVVLASQASWRSNILKQLGIKHSQVNHRYKEPKFVQGSLKDFIESIAREKAKSICHEFSEAIIVAADQLICIENQILYKPGNREKAIAQLQMLNGKTHDLICAVSVFYQGSVESDIEIAELEMRVLQEQEIQNYVDSDKPWDCAGSYKIESLGASLFKSINVNDPTAIIGLPSNKLLDILRKMGFSNLL